MRIEMNETDIKKGLIKFLKNDFGIEATPEEIEISIEYTHSKILAAWESGKDFSENELDN